MDSNLYGAFPVKWLFSVYCQFFVRSGRPFFIPLPTIRFPERAEWGQGTETLAKLGAFARTAQRARETRIGHRGGLADPAIADRPALNAR
jgi:hypothetical protein